MKSINGPKSPDMAKKYSIKQYPSLVIETSTGSVKPYSGDRTMKDLKKFLS